MYRIIRPFLGFILALALSFSGALAMPGMGGEGLMPIVICGEDGAEAVWLDANGAIVPAPQHDCRDCPKCLACNGPSDVKRAFLTAWHPPRTAGLVLHPCGLTVLHDNVHLHPAPRGPPSSTFADKGQIAASLILRASAPASLEFRQVMRGQFVQNTGRPTKDARE